MLKKYFLKETVTILPLPTNLQLACNLFLQSSFVFLTSESSYPGSQEFRRIIKKEYVLFLSLLNLLSPCRLPMDMPIATDFERNPVCYLSIFVDCSLPKTPFRLGVWFFVCVDFFLNTHFIRNTQKYSARYLGP